VGVYAEHFLDIQPACITLAALSLAILVFWPRVSRTIPGRSSPARPDDHGRAFVRSRRRDHRQPLRRSRIVSRGRRFRPVDLATCSVQLVGPAFAIALLAAIESLLSAVVADGMIGGRHRSNMELVATGRREHRNAAVRRHARHRCHRPHRDQRPQRRPYTQSRESCTP
jgi:sulfate permease, SulP family